MKKLTLWLIFFLAPMVLACAPAIAAVQPQYSVPDVLNLSNYTAGQQRVLGSLRGANMNVTTDQPITIISTITKYSVDRVVVTNCSGTPTLAAGGLYTSASKGGSAIVGAGQAYTALSSSSTMLPLTLAITTSTFTATTLYLSLTTANGSAMTCDVYVIVTDLT